MSENAVHTDVAQFTDVITTAFEKYTDAPDTVVTDIQEKGEQLATDVEELETDVERLSTLGDGAMQQIKSLKGTIDDVEEDVSELNKDIEHQTPTPDGTQTPLHDTVSPLEQITGFTEKESLKHLSSNQQLARNVAMDAIHVGKKTPKGVVIDHSTLKTELTKMKGTSPHKMDLKRVRDFLDDLGGENVTQVSNKGKKLVVFEKEYAKELGRESYAPNESIVVQHPNSWRDIVQSQSCRDHNTKASVPA